jgi:CPA2 family monovalent cation:H+ antiporter-2
VTLVGYGRVGRRIADALTAQGIPIVVAEDDRDAVEALRARGIPAVSGDASEPIVLIQAHIARARMLVIAIPDPVAIRAMVDTARTLNPRIDIVVRTHSDDEGVLMRDAGVQSVFMGEHELARAMTRHIIERIGGDPPPAA